MKNPQQVAGSKKQSGEAAKNNGAKIAPPAIKNKESVSQSLQDSINLNPDFNFDKYGIGVEDIKTEAEQLLKQSNEVKENKGLFTVKTGSRCS